MREKNSINSKLFLEEVPLYTPKGKRAAAQVKTNYPPGWHPEAAKSTKQSQHQRSKVPTPTNSSTATATTTAKTEPAPQINNNTSCSSKIDEVTEAMQNSLKIREDVVELSKRLKRLRRRLRELDILEEKIKSGEIQKPQKDQVEKISRRAEMEKEVEELEKQREELKAQGFKCGEDDS